MDVEFTKNFTHTMIDFINVIEHPTISISIRFKLNQLKKKGNFHQTDIRKFFSHFICKQQKKRKMVQHK